MTVPPFAEAGAKATLTDASPALVVTDVGAAGAPTTVTDADAPEAVDVPTTFVAVTVHVYELAGVSDATEMGLDAPVLVRAIPVPDAHVAE